MKNLKTVGFVVFIAFFISVISIEGQSNEPIAFNISSPQLVLDVGSSGEFDSLFVSDLCVLKVSGKYLMYYTGYGDDENEKNWVKIWYVGVNLNYLLDSEFMRIFYVEGE